MSFDGGSFVTQNKVLPGVYVNVSAENKVSSELSERGIAALGLELDWGPSGEVFYLSASDFRKNSQAYFGYGYASEEMKGLRDLFVRAAGCYFYRLNAGEAAANALCTAKYGGVRGNDLSIVVSEAEGAFMVATYLDGQEVDAQAVNSAVELQDNAYVCWKSDAELTASSGLPLSGGTNLTDVGVDAYQEMLDKLEEVRFNVLGCLSTDTAVQQLFTNYTRSQRNASAARFQTVLYRCDANYEGIISPVNAVRDACWPESSIVYWLCGAEAACAVNATLTNSVYDGEFDVIPLVASSELQAALQGGKIALHKLGEQLRVLEDVNTLLTVGDGQSEDMKFNQTMRVLDQIVTDLSNLFYQKYLGVVLNDSSGRVSLWNDIVSYYRKLEGLHAIESFEASDIAVKQGDNKKAVVISSYLTVINAMSQLYLTVTFA